MLASQEDISWNTKNHQEMHLLVSSMKAHPVILGQLFLINLIF